MLCCPCPAFAEENKRTLVADQCEAKSLIICCGLHEAVELDPGMGKSGSARALIAVSDANLLSLINLEVGNARQTLYWQSSTSISCSG